MEPFATAITLSAVAALLLLASVVTPLSRRLGVPALLLFLVLGMLAGSEGPGGIPFDDYGSAFTAGCTALVLILFEGGLQTSPAVLRRTAAPAALLATVAVVGTAAAVACAAWLLGLPPAVAILIGAVVSSTDAAAVFSVLQTAGVRLNERTGSTLEVESGLNDPMAVLLTTIATEALAGRLPLGWGMARVLALQVVVGVLGGVAFGSGAGWMLRRSAFPAAGLYPVVTTAVAFAAFGVTTLAGGSGFLAVYLAGVLIGSARVPHRATVRAFHQGLAWLSQVAMFLLLGLLVFPSRLVPLADEGLVLAGTLAFVARPLAVLVSLLPFRYTARERLFVAWVGLRGAVPIVLATFPATLGLAAADHVFHLVFFVVLATSILPGATVPWLARRLGLDQGLPVVADPHVEIVSHRDGPGEFIWYAVTRAAAACDAAVHELPLPSGVQLVLVLRGDDVVPLGPQATLRAGDQVCVLAQPGDRAFVDLVFGRVQAEDV